MANWTEEEIHMDLTGFAFGIRVNKSFYIEDKLGAITDYILYTKGSEFNPNVFPQVQDHGSVKVLCNDRNNNRFTINHSDFIFDYNIKDSFDSEFDKFLSSYSSIITKRLFKEFGIRNILRFGFIIRAKSKDGDELTQKVDALVKDKYPKFNGDSLAIRFNVKEKKPLKIMGEITEDFDNTIVTYDRADENSPLMFSVDYQKYFKPELGDISEAPQGFEEFCRSCLKNYKATYCK